VLSFAQDWTVFDKYHCTITRKEFCRLIDEIYNPSKTVYTYLNVTDEYVEFFSDKGKTQLDFTLWFATSDAKRVRSYPTFKTVEDLRELKNTKARPLEGVRIVIDPGHIGGKWAGMEERSVVWGKNAAIREGDKNLQVAKLIKARLEAAGAEIYMTHTTAEPVTPMRPKDFLEEAKTEVFKKNKVTEETAKPRKEYFQRLINLRAEFMFYRRAEIAQRADNIRNLFLPDLNICNHFNATEDSGSGVIVKDNRHAFFINGCYGPDEVDESISRFFLFSKLLEQPLDIEMGLADSMTHHMLKVAHLPPVNYGKEKYQCRVNKNPYLYARNLAASRQYPGPCIILEPFYMNNAWTAERLTAGDYDGVKKVAGGMYRSIFREYADAMAQAVIETYSKWTVPSPVKRPASVPAAPVEGPSS
jgi:N-acetylmuramoyl-L-alanine amidase